MAKDFKTDWPPDYEKVQMWQNAMLAKFELDLELVEHAKAYYKHNPIDFINHWCYIYEPRNAYRGKPTRFPFILFQRQAELVKFVLACLDGEAPGLVEKCRDMGATWVCVALSVWLWLFWPGAAVGWGSRKQELVDRLGDATSIVEKARQLIRRLPSVFFEPQFISDQHMPYMKIVNPAKESSIIGEIGDNIGRGGRTLIYFKDESAHYERPDSIEASLSETTRVPIDISSVAGLGNVFHRKREAGIEWAVDAPVERFQTNVFIMDVFDHPEKDREWYVNRKQYYEQQGLSHVFAQEIDRDYAASIEGTIIELDWIKAAVGAHEKLGFDDDGGHMVGLDVGDKVTGGDPNGFARRKGVILKDVDQWVARDVGISTRNAIRKCEGYSPINLQYDSIGIGAGVKVEVNRLLEDELIPTHQKEQLRNMTFVPWAGSAKVLNPNEHVIPNDKESPLNRDQYENLKAQAWWELRLRFERTYRAIEAHDNGESYDVKPEELISIDPQISSDKMRKIEKELAQPTISANARLKLVVDKTPQGTKSPNIADAIVMCYWPVKPPRRRVALTAPVFVNG